MGSVVVKNEKLNHLCSVNIFHNNSGMPGAISTKIGTCITYYSGPYTVVTRHSSGGGGKGIHIKIMLIC